MNPESRDMSGYYFITDGPTRVYCGMAYTGSSCEDIYNNNPETGDKSGYHRINDSHRTGCVVEQEDIRKEKRMPFMHTIIMVGVKQQLTAIMLMTY